MEYMHKTDAPMCFDLIDQRLVNSLHDEGHNLWRALKLVVNDHRIKTWLQANDPRTLEQAITALEGAHHDPIANRKEIG